MKQKMDSLYKFLEDAFSSEYLFIRFLAIVMIATGALVFILLQVIRSAYGRYGNRSWGPDIDPKVAWFIQELPSFLVPVSLLLFTDCPKLSGLPNKILLAIFLIHYFQRWVYCWLKLPSNIISNLPELFSWNRKLLKQVFLF